MRNWLPWPRAYEAEGRAADELREPANRCTTCGFVAKSKAGLSAHKRAKGH